MVLPGLPQFLEIGDSDEALVAKLSRGDVDVRRHDVAEPEEIEHAQRNTQQELTHLSLLEECSFAIRVDLRGRLRARERSLDGPRASSGEPRHPC